MYILVEGLLNKMHRAKRLNLMMVFATGFWKVCFRVSIKKHEGEVRQQRRTCLGQLGWRYAPVGAVFVVVCKEISSFSECPSDT